MAEETFCSYSVWAAKRDGPNPVLRRAALYGLVSDTPRLCYGGQIAFWGLGTKRQTGLCATQRIGGRLDNLALQNCLLPTELVIRSIHPLRDIYIVLGWFRAKSTGNLRMGGVSWNTVMRFRLENPSRPRSRFSGFGDRAQYPLHLSTGSENPS